MPDILTTGYSSGQPTRQKQAQKSGCRPGHHKVSGQNRTRTPIGQQISRSGDLVIPGPERQPDIGRPPTPVPTSEVPEEIVGSYRV
jgi:hypothetical protein